MNTHKVDKGGDGRSWTGYDQRVGHILAYRRKGNGGEAQEEPGAEEPGGQEGKATRETEGTTCPHTWGW